MDWRRVLQLLGSLQSPGVLEASAEAICLLLSVQDIPDLFHLLFTVYLLHPHQTTRLNAAFILKLFCIHYQKLCRELLVLSESDGILEAFNVFSYEQLLSPDQPPLLCGKQGLEDNDQYKDIYKKDWLIKQKRAFKKLIRSSIDTEEVALALDATTDDVDDEMIIVDENLPTTSSKTTSNMPTSKSTAEINQYSATTSETWLARLTRFLIAQLLHEKWEHREGAALGLRSLIIGLSYSITNEVDEGYRNFLPSFILEDIACVGSTALILDRVIDFQEMHQQPSKNKIFNIESYGEGVLPVKEALSVLIVRTVEAIGTHTAAIKLCNIAIALLQQHTNWTVVYGGILLLRQLVMFLPAIVLEKLEEILRCTVKILLLDYLPPEVHILVIMLLKNIINILDSSSNCILHRQIVLNELINLISDCLTLDSSMVDIPLILSHAILFINTLSLLPACFTSEQSEQLQATLSTVLRRINLCLFRCVNKESIPIYTIKPLVEDITKAFISLKMLSDVTIEVRNELWSLANILLKAGSLRSGDYDVTAGK
jgi:hypothetical protein